MTEGVQSVMLMCSLRQTGVWLVNVDECSL